MFIDDYSIDSMLHAVIIRSPLSHGKLEEILCHDLEPEYTLITAKDIPGINELYDFPVPVLASEYLSYTGEPIGLLTGPDLEKLEKIASKCIIKVDEFVTEGDDSRKESLLEAPSFLKTNYSSDDPDYNSNSMPELIASGTYETGTQEHWYSESHGALAYFHDDILTVLTATQWPFNVKRSLAKMLKISDIKITVIQTESGLHLDGKIIFPSLITCQAALAAFITKSRIKLKLSRTEDFRYSPKRSASETHIVSALDKNGKIINTEIISAIDIGSQDIFSAEMLNQICTGSRGIYKLGKINIEGIALKTKKPPQGPMEGFGISQGFFAIERHASRLAETLKQDPAEWRKQNCLHKYEKTVKELIDCAAVNSDYYRKWASYELLKKTMKRKWELNEHETKRGIGISMAYQGSGFLDNTSNMANYGIELTLGKDSSLVIKTSILPNSTENERIWQEMAVEILGIDQNLVEIKTQVNIIDSGPDCLSRKITFITDLVENCLKAIRKQRFRHPLPITVRRNIKLEKSTAIENPAWAAAVIEVEIDNISMQPIIHGIWMLADAGRILSMSNAKRSLKLAVINALSWSIHEQVFYRNGEIPPGNIDNYDILSPKDIPPIYIDFLQHNNTHPKGIGELPYSVIPAAYSQAVSQAMDHPFEKIPLTQEHIWDVLKNKTAELQV